MNERPTTYLMALKNLKTDAVLLLVAVGIYTMTVFSGMHAVLFNLYLLRMKYGTEFIGVINGFGMFFRGVAALHAGTAMRRMANRMKMIAGLIILMATRGLRPVADLLPLHLRTIWLIIAFSVSQCGSSLFFVSGKPFLMHVTGAEERDHAFALLVPFIMSRLGHRRAFPCSSLAISAGVALVCVLPHWLGASAGYIVAIAMLNIQGIVANVVQLEMVAGSWRSTMAGATLMAKGIGRTGISLAGGFLIAFLGYRPFFLLGALLPLVGIALFALKFPSLPDRHG